MRPLSRGAEPAPRDPAPSRVSYRLQRLWLTPLFRSLVRTGLPALAVTAGLGVYLADEDTQESIQIAVADLRRSIAERPEFTVKLMAIDGASESLSEDIREVLSLDFPVSSFDLELDEMQRRIAGLDAVARAELRIRQGGILQIEIAERVPAVVWRADDALELLDAGGRRVAPLASRLDRPDLPLIAGEGADAAVPEALRLLAAAETLTDRVRGLVRVGERRWDLVLTRDQRILLPEDGPVRALEQVIALDDAQDLLARDVAAVDMRNPARATVRLSATAVEELQRIRAIESGDWKG